MKLVDKICKYKMDPASTVEDTKRTWFGLQTVGRTDRESETSIPPSTFLAQGFNNLLQHKQSYTPATFTNIPQDSVPGVLHHNFINPG